MKLLLVERILLVIKLEGLVAELVELEIELTVLIVDIAVKVP